MFFKTEAILREFVENVVGGDKLPRILSPNLGCPLFLHINGPDAQTDLWPIVVACEPDETNWGDYVFTAVPSFTDENHKYEGKGFEFDLSAQPFPLDNPMLPARFDDLRETRHLISNFMRKSVFPKARFWSFKVSPKITVSENNCRRAHQGGPPLATLFDLVLTVRGIKCSVVKHAICVRPHSSGVRFAHLTDLHVAERNDIWKKEWGSTIGSEPTAANQQIVNFNQHLRTFIKWANKEANEGRLDFVLVLGDLVDFVAQGLGDSPTDESNWRFVWEMFLGGGEEPRRGNLGLRVPIFTSTGNHDWRFSPYPPEDVEVINKNPNTNIFGIEYSEAKKIDYLYHDSSETIGKRIAEVNSKLIRDGSPVLARSWWGSLLGFGLKAIEVAFTSMTTRFLAVAGTVSKIQYTPLAFLLLILGTLGIHIKYFEGKATLANHVMWGVLILEGAVFLTLPFLRNWVGAKLRQVITGVMSIEAGTEALTEYFLLFNPYFNHAFQLGKCKFLLLDTGPDCLTGQSFWDDGGKKVQRVTVRDNILGGSPDSMAFYAPNDNYPYSQISWLELVLDCVRRGRRHSTGQEQNFLAGARRSFRVFAGIHAPAGNLSRPDREKVKKQFAGAKEKPVPILPKQQGGFTIHYGCINHFLSQFYYLALGRSEEHRDTISGPGIDYVLSGHTHWNMEFEIKPAANQGDGKHHRPEILYGAFSKNLQERVEHADKWWPPLLLQTASCGVPSSTQQENPNFRCITVDDALRVTELTPLKWSSEKNAPVPAPIL
jgi:predicted MPP superfamily phosphohydrolase